LNYLLDTCVLSEFTHRNPAGQVINWLDSQDEDRIYLSVISIGQIQRGIARLPDSSRKSEIARWLSEGLSARFGKRILELDQATMIRWGWLTVRLEAARKPMSVIDSLIAATALQYDLILATLNVNDFQPSGIQIINPWEQRQRV
jgi:toxin FitB